MRPFKMFFGLSLAFMFFFFIAKFFVFAFIAAAIMSIVYAVFRRIKDFITYDSFGEHYIKRYRPRPGIPSNWNNEVEPLFHSPVSRSRKSSGPIHFVDIA